MKWSRYNRLFKSKRNGWLLYNAAAGSFLQLSDQAAEAVLCIKQNPDAYDFSEQPQLYLTLRHLGCIVEDSQDDDFYNILKMRRLTAAYAATSLLLTVAITRNCNFACSYCYESNRTGKPMSHETAQKLLDFIAMHKKMDKLNIIWYGGEPLLGIERIRELDAKFKEANYDYTAMLVTNGSLFDDSIISDLNMLHIDRIQITLDGCKETHDSRRFQVDGKGTFDRILENLNKIMNSDYKGIVQIRVNVDMRNKADYIDVYRLIKEQYTDTYGKRIFVYPGFVKGDGHPDASCFFDSSLTGKFVADIAREEGVEAMSLFPHMASYGCTLTRHNAYVVGPDGELYKCWDDIGLPEMVIGHIDDFTNWNMSLYARGMVGASYLESEECKNCFYFPVCDGGCHKIRLRNLMDKGNRDCCSYFRDHLEELLELHFEQKQRAQKTEHV
ncbi:MAG: radical SAM protein [Treponema sp.]|nr:radical SAM protein [Treponema sp.]